MANPQQHLREPLCKKPLVSQIFFSKQQLQVYLEGTLSSGIFPPQMGLVFYVIG
jgi:hypothetical protein